MSARKGGASERLAAASLQLASGVGEAASAAAELQRAMDQISRGAEEAASAAQESSGSISSLVRDFGEARDQAVASLMRTEQLQTSFIDTHAQIEGSISAIELNADRQLASVAVIASLEEKAGGIGAISRDVSDVSEQTGLLALNAALEAARAGDHGRGFSIVADEVRMLAEGSEARAGEIRKLSDEIRGTVQAISKRIKDASDSATRESAGGRGLMQRLATSRDDLAILADGAQTIVQAATEAEAAAREAGRGAEQVASAAEEQSAAAAEAQQAVQQQSQSLDQSHQAAEEIATIAEQSADGATTNLGAQISAAAEELSATVQEISGSAAQILVAIDQIGKGAELQSSATLQADTAMGQIEKSAAAAMQRAAEANERVTALQTLIDDGRDVVRRLVDGVATALQESREIGALMLGLADTTRRIERLVDGLALVAVQINMLAVSGSVEATRAGDAGSGFATVASDIRNLSRTAAENADGAKDIVGRMQDEIGDLRRDLELIAGAGELEVSRNHAVIARLDTMVTELAALASSSDAIIQGAESIITAARQVRAGTEQISSVAQEAAAAAQEAASAARQQAQGAEDLAAAIEEIASLSTALVPAGA
ncbi:methyl-accepting chemotaxis protein [Sphingomonas chungangi]|nr:methyl-accepting chemotaxis protein [Sphingomonas chungangi]